MHEITNNINNHLCADNLQAKGGVVGSKFSIFENINYFNCGYNEVACQTEYNYGFQCGDGC